MQENYFLDLRLISEKRSPADVGDLRRGFFAPQKNGENLQG